jgi:2-polyprenyl-3-methyl-5-hydroxy-6-metoxy-1,4-benzoquinol methylase
VSGYDINQLICPLCLNEETQYRASKQNRDFFQCTKCELISTPLHQQLCHEMEKAVYDQHENNPSDQRYRKFLSQIVDPLLLYLKPNSTGLDFGCGPGPTLSIMLEEAGHNVKVYDPYYFPDPEKLKLKYQFITMTEVAEHLANPRKEFKIIKNMLLPQSLLAIMTKFIPVEKEFIEWSYLNDPTHIVFYNEKTMYWLENFLECELIFIQKNLAIFRKS